MIAVSGGRLWPALRRFEMWRDKLHGISVADETNLCFGEFEQW